MTLFTCTVGGRARYAIRCVRAEDFSLGIQRFFWVYPEIEDIYKEIFRA